MSIPQYFLIALCSFMNINYTSYINHSFNYIEEHFNTEKNIYHKSIIFIQPDGSKIIDSKGLDIPDHVIDFRAITNDQLKSINDINYPVLVLKYRPRKYVDIKTIKPLCDRI